MNHPNSTVTQILAVSTVTQILAVDTLIACEGLQQETLDWYAILGVPRYPYDFLAIKDHYKKLCLLLDPNENPDIAQVPHSGDAFKRVNKAWFVLGNKRQSLNDSKNREKILTESESLLQAAKTYIENGEFHQFSEAGQEIIDIAGGKRLDDVDYLKDDKKALVDSGIKKKHIYDNQELKTEEDAGDGGFCNGGDIEETEFGEASDFCTSGKVPLLLDAKQNEDEELKTEEDAGNRGLCDGDYIEKAEFGEGLDFLGAELLTDGKIKILLDTIACGSELVKKNEGKELKTEDANEVDDKKFKVCTCKMLCAYHKDDSSFSFKNYKTQLQMARDDYAELLTRYNSLKHERDILKGEILAVRKLRFKENQLPVSLWENAFSGKESGSSPYARPQLGGSPHHKDCGARKIILILMTSLTVAELAIKMTGTGHAESGSYFTASHLIALMVFVLSMAVFCLETGWVEALDLAAQFQNVAAILFYKFVTKENPPVDGGLLSLAISIVCLTMHWMHHHERDKDDDNDDDNDLGRSFLHRIVEFL